MKSKQFSWISIFPLIIAIVFIALAIAQALPFWQKAFRSDNSAISWLSSAQLWSIAFIYLLLIQEKTISEKLGGWLFLSFIVLAIDEQFHFHEQWKYQCMDWLSACKNTWIKEAPMIFLVIIGSVSAFLYYGECQNKMARVFLSTSFMLGLTAIYIDLFPAPYIMAILEEGFEVMAEAFWLSSLLALKK
jgi:hypothetical protein